jgi:hypothetical protein
MKQAFTRESPQNVQTQKHVRTENKDNLDSRKNEEWDNKGDNVTHNKKETKENKKPGQH